MKLRSGSVRFLLAPFVLASFAVPASAQCLPSPVAEWLPDSPGDDDEFGLTVALSGDRAVVGAPYDDDRGPNAGAVYAYLRVASVWQFQAKFYASDTVGDDQFGVDVDIDGDVIVVGAWQHDHGQGPHAGAAYVFEWGTWQNCVELHGSGTVGGVTQFASSLAVSGDTIVVGSMYDDTGCGGTGTYCGAAYVYVRPDLGWCIPPSNPLLETTRLDSSFPLHGARFGAEVAIDESLIAVDAYHDTNQGIPYAGLVYLFERPSVGGWASGAIPRARIGSVSPESYDEFGLRLAVQYNAGGPDIVAIGARSRPPSEGKPGAAYAVHEPSGGWADMTVQPNLISSQITADDSYGAGIAIDGDRIAVGSASDDPFCNDGSGRAFVFERQGNDWMEAYWLEVPISDSDSGYTPALGHGLALDAGTVVVGAPFDDNARGHDAGVVYAFDLAPCTISLYCFCDGGAVCGNFDSAAGCQNSTGIGAPFVGSTGTMSVAADDLVLSATCLPINQFGLVYMGGAPIEVPFGDGLRCVGSGGIGIYRYSPPRIRGRSGRSFWGRGSSRAPRAFHPLVISTRETPGTSRPGIATRWGSVAASSTSPMPFL